MDIDKNNDSIPKTDKSIEAIVKIFPYFGKDNNSQGYYIGDFKIISNSNDLPFTSLDQVDYMIYNLQNYSKNRKNPKDFFISKREKIKFVPSKLQQEGGKKKYKNKKNIKKTRLTKRKSTRNKRKTIKLKEKQ